MLRAHKEQTVAELSSRLSEAKCLYLADFTGLDVTAITELRRQLRDAGVDFVVVKNTLARRALAGGPYEALVEHLEGPSAFALSNEDVVSPAKVLTDFAKDTNRPQIKSGAIEGQVLSFEEIQRIAKLPPREQLLAQVVGFARAPMAGLVYTLNGLLAQFVRTLDAVRQARESEEPVVATATPPAETEDTESASEDRTADAADDAPEVSEEAADEVSEETEDEQ